MPQQWGLEGKISANDLGNGCFLFSFEIEEDLQMVLSQGPFHFNFWMIVLVQWKPVIHDKYPWEISLWTQFTGLPLHYWLEGTMRSIGEKLGFVHEVDELNARLWITFDTRKPLKFIHKIRLLGGEEATIQIAYERLFKYCSLCGLLAHDASTCPRKEPDPNLQRTKPFRTHVRG